MRTSEYPQTYDMFKHRNSQFWALEKCLKIYENEGGKREDLNRHYELADMVAAFFYDKCDKTTRDCFMARLEQFSEAATCPAVVLKQLYCKTEENKKLCDYLELESQKEIRLPPQQSK